MNKVLTLNISCDGNKKISESTEKYNNFSQLKISYNNGSFYTHDNNNHPMELLDGDCLSFSSLSITVSIENSHLPENTIFAINQAENLRANSSTDYSYNGLANLNTQEKILEELNYQSTNEDPLAFLNDGTTSASPLKLDNKIPLADINSPEKNNGKMKLISDYFKAPKAFNGVTKVDPELMPVAHEPTEGNILKDLGFTGSHYTYKEEQRPSNHTDYNTRLTLDTHYELASKHLPIVKPDKSNVFNHMKNFIKRIASKELPNNVI